MNQDLNINKSYVTDDSGTFSGIMQGDSSLEMSQISAITGAGSLMETNEATKNEKNPLTKESGGQSS